MQIEFQDAIVDQAMLNILLKTPWLIRNPRNIIETLAIRGYVDHIRFLLVHYRDESDQMKEYMKSIVLRAISFLPVVPDDMWSQVVDSSVSPSHVTSLMATETWIKVAKDQPGLVQEIHLQEIEAALNRNPKPIMRVMKNYLLILGERKREIIVEEDNQDVLIQNVREIIRSNEINALFGYFEPEVLSREFYSGYRDDGDYHPSSP